MNKTTLVIIFVLIFLIVLMFLKEKSNVSDYTRLKDDAVILAFGDSLTNGFGAEDGYSYPEILEQKIGLRVIKSGINGELSSQGLQRLPLYLEENPDLVILCHGSNDMLNHLAENELKSNLLKMVSLIQESGAQVVLIGVPMFNSYSFGVHQVYKEVAEEMHLILEDESLHHIELTRSLKSDYVHPNEEGYEFIADTLISLLRKNNLIS